jgi:hypothetical protein
VLAERGLRHRPRPRISRPGFHYGFGPEVLEGGGYPSYAHIRKISTGGSVPLLKLHGSVSWSVQCGELVKYHDCRPAIRGDAAIVAPVASKTLPAYLQSTWDLAGRLLAQSSTWIVVGYSLPPYDQLVRDLLASNHRAQAVYVFDPDPLVADRFRSLLPASLVAAKRRVPEGLPELKVVIESG